MTRRAAPAAEAVARTRVVADPALAGPAQPQHELEVLLRVAVRRIERDRPLEVALAAAQQRGDPAPVGAGSGARHDEHAEQVRGGRALLGADAGQHHALERLLGLGAERRQIHSRLGVDADPAEPEELQATAVGDRVAGADQRAGRVAGQEGRTDSRASGARAAPGSGCRRAQPSSPGTRVDGEQEEDRRDRGEGEGGERRRDGGGRSVTSLLPSRAACSRARCRRAGARAGRRARAGPRAQSAATACSRRVAVCVKTLGETNAFCPKSVANRRRFSGSAKSGTIRTGMCSRWSRSASPDRAGRSADASSRSLTMRIAPCLTCARFSALLRSRSARPRSACRR